MLAKFRGKSGARFLLALFFPALIHYAIWVAYPTASFGQSSGSGPMRDQPPSITPLEDLLKEAAENHPGIRAASVAVRAAQYLPSQVSTLPDPQFTVQQFSVGSPRPFAGYTNSDFAYLGLGVSQDFPYPGKLRLRSELAKRDAEVLQQRYEALRLSILAQLKSSYFHLAYHSKVLAILGADGDLLRQVEQAADTRYRVGGGSQQDLIRAQLEQTKLLREVTMHHLEMAKWQAQIKQLLNRPQSSPDIQPEDLTERLFERTYDELLAAARVQNPEIAAAEKMIEKQSAQIEMARKDFYPDFNVQYMWQRTDPAKYRAYYMLSFGIRIPVFRARREYEAQSQQVAYELREQYETAAKTAELLKLYREALSPQARAAFQAGLAAYTSNRQDFQGLLSAFLDVLQLDEQYWGDVSSYETAVARLEQLTALRLR